jgi:hypothetical protein
MCLITMADAEESTFVPNQEYERECQIVGLYIDSAKSYSQLSTGALALAAVFGSRTLNEFGVGLLVACVCFLIAALSGGAYQSLAVGRLEMLSGLAIERNRPLPRSWNDNAYVFYNILVAAFHIGAITLGVAAVAQLWQGVASVPCPPAGE